MLDILIGVASVIFPVCLGNGTAEQLNRRRAIGQQVRIGRRTFTVSGVLAANGLNGDLIVMPINTVR